jgi:raffinose/stachyose/melibiose transport system substrate-binding protein
MGRTVRILAALVLVPFLSGCLYDDDSISRQNSKKKQLTLYTIQGDSAVGQVIADSEKRF